MIHISDDKTKLNPEVIHAFLTRSYWAGGRTLEQVKATIQNSPFCFGVYLDNEQIGFARVMTDGVVFGYLMDVFILEEHRGKGYSKVLLDKIFSHPGLKQIPKWLLGTSDAHGLYKKFGFTPMAHPERMMEWKK